MCVALLALLVFCTRAVVSLRPIWVRVDVCDVVSLSSVESVVCVRDTSSHLQPSTQKRKRQSARCRQDVKRKKDSALLGFLSTVNRR